MKLVLVTPLRNEVKNIERLFKSINNQSIVIQDWIIVENDSDDGSKKMLNAVNSPKTVKNIHILNIELGGKYQLGHKYSAVVKKGFDYVNEKEMEFDYIGILDADCFPEKNYYKLLTDVLKSDKKIGLVGGVLYLDQNNSEKTNPDHIRGSGRLWEKKCFIDSDYKVGISADANSLIRAKVAGWKTKLVKEAKFYSRAATSRVSKEYAGKSAYYNGFSLTYVFLKFLKYLILRPKLSFKFMAGFLKSIKDNAPKNEDQIIINYNRKRLRNKIKEKIKRNF